MAASARLSESTCAKMARPMAASANAIGSMRNGPNQSMIGPNNVAYTVVSALRIPKWTPAAVSLTPYIEVRCRVNTFPSV